MPLPRKKLPISIPTFATLIRDGYYYVDKTDFARQLIDEGKYYFLSRPRRFGKSLFLDTLKELFEGNQALFDGLAIASDWDFSVRHPVIRISFGGDSLATLAELNAAISQQLEGHEHQFGLPARYKDARGRLRDLVRRLHEKDGQSVVVLIDEYDKPLLDNIEKPKLAEAMRGKLKTLYSVLKDLDAHLRFVFLTGVTKVSRGSLFSGLNNLEDITMDAAYSALCGYAEADLDHTFAAELCGLDRQQIRRWYYGYNWRGTAVYNPFDLLLLFANREFSHWWFETGTPTFLIKLMAKQRFFTPRLAGFRTGAELISTFELDHIPAEALLFQAGYLTIAGTEQTAAGNVRYVLRYPNHEVETAINNRLLTGYAGAADNAEEQRARLEDLLVAGDVAGMRELFHAFFAGSPDRSIPNNWYANNPIVSYEGYYASVFYSYFAVLGFDLRVEDATNHGRIDMALLLPARVYLFEFKVVELLPEGGALQQLLDKGYADKYRDLGVPVVLVGVEFSRVARNVVGFDVAGAAGL